MRSRVYATLWRPSVCPSVCPFFRPSRYSSGGAKCNAQKGKGSPYSITERRVPELIPVLGSQPAGDVRHKPDGRLLLLSARPPRD